MRFYSVSILQNPLGPTAFQPTKKHWVLYPRVAGAQHVFRNLSISGLKHVKAMVCKNTLTNQSMASTYKNGYQIIPIVH